MEIVGLGGALRNDRRPDHCHLGQDAVRMCAIFVEICDHVMFAQDSEDIIYTSAGTYPMKLALSAQSFWHGNTIDAFDPPYHTFSDKKRKASLDY